MSIYQDLDKLYEKIEKIENENKRLNRELEKYKYSADELNEIVRLNKALLDIKELVLNNARLNKEDNRCDLDLIYYKCNELLDIVNNALGVDKE